MLSDRPSRASGPWAGQRMASRRRSRGLTLVELMVAIAISLFMIAALVVLYVNNSAARAELDRSSRQIENGRFAIDMLRDDIALAGFYGPLAQREVGEYVQANPCTTATATLATVWSTAGPVRAPAPVQGPDGDTEIPTAWNCATLNQRAGTGYLIVRRLAPEAIAPAATAPATHYVQVNGCLDTGTPFRFANGSGAAAFTLTAADCATVAPVRAYQSRLYYVANCGVCSPSDGVPTLKMRELQGNQIVERTIADGIEDLQFEFGFDRNGDGLADETFTDFADLVPDPAPAPPPSWGNVVTVRVHLISRATAPSPGYTDTKTYDRGVFGAYAPPGDALQFKRRAYTALVQLPNVAGPRETP